MLAGQSESWSYFLSSWSAVELQEEKFDWAGGTHILFRIISSFNKWSYKLLCMTQWSELSLLILMVYFSCCHRLSTDSNNMPEWWGVMSNLLLLAFWHADPKSQSAWYAAWCQWRTEPRCLPQCFECWISRVLFFPPFNYFISKSCNFDTVAKISIVFYNISQFFWINFIKLYTRSDTTHNKINNNYYYIIIIIVN